MASKRNVGKPKCGYEKFLVYLQVLQEESGVSLNAVESVDKFVCDVQHGKWDEVLKTAAMMSLKDDTQQMLYEQVS